MKLFRVLTNLLRKFGINANRIELTANDILNLIAGNEINLKSRNLTIKSDNFSVDKNGNLSCSNANINGGKVNVKGISTNNDLLRATSTEENIFTYIQPMGIGIVGSNEHRIDCIVQNKHSNYSSIEVSGGGNRSTITNDYIETPRLAQTSLESIKKNISKLDKNALDIISQSDIYEYNLKSEKDTDKKHIGFVIGENYKTPQEVISKEGNSIELYSAIGILWKAIQEQQKQNEKLTKRIEELESLYPNQAII